MLFSWSSQLEQTLLLQRSVYPHILPLIIPLDVRCSKLLEQPALEPSLFIRVVVWIISHFRPYWACRTVDELLVE